MENEFNTLSQDDIDSLFNEGEGETDTSPDSVAPVYIPPEPDGPIPKVVNLTGLDVSSVVSKVAPALAATPETPPTPPPALSEVPAAPPTAAVPAPIPDSSGPKIMELEQSIIATNTSLQEIMREVQGLAQQVQGLAHSIEAIAKGLKETPAYRVRETFKCGTCESQHNVAMPVKCTQCGRVNWWGWWPSKRE